jgi:hypothetical protein
VSFVWPDHGDRLAALRSALDVARASIPRVERAQAAADWLIARLARPVAGAATVVFHSIVWLYLALRPNDGCELSSKMPGAALLRRAPLAWLRFEPSADGRCCDMRLHSWPGGTDRLLATAGYHGRPVRWLT